MANTLCEKIADKQITEYLKKKGKRPKEVGEARPRRLTTSNIEALFNTMQKGLQVKRHFAFGLYDLEDAYSRVHEPTHAKRMTKYGNTDVMFGWILSMQDTRRCKMRFGT